MSNNVNDEFVGDVNASPATPSTPAVNITVELRDAVLRASEVVLLGYAKKGLKNDKGYNMTIMGWMQLFNHIHARCEDKGFDMKDVKVGDIVFDAIKHRKAPWIRIWKKDENKRGGASWQSHVKLDMSYLDSVEASIQ